VKWVAILLPIVGAMIVPGSVRAEPRTVVMEPGTQPVPPPSTTSNPAAPPPAVTGTSQGQPQQPPSPTTPVQSGAPGQPDLRGTRNAPIAVEITNAAELQTKTLSGIQTQGAQTQGQGLTPGAASVRAPYVGWALVIIALIQAAVFAVQAILLKRTVARMDATAEQQLRAYISVTPDNVVAWNQPEGISVSFNIENHGQTVGSRIRYDFGIAIIDRLPSDAVMPATTAQLSANNTLFPREKRGYRFDLRRTVTAAEAADVETDAKRLYVWGTLFYHDAFGTQRTTGFSFSAGGAAFAQTQRGTRGTLTAWHWEFGAQHNATT
jgi:hypothetical protein